MKDKKMKMMMKMKMMTILRLGMISRGLKYNLDEGRVSLFFFFIVKIIQKGYNIN